ncbi:MAG TPA: NADP-dependent malic enzyme [Atribacteraceae bacterium]|nr:NADP-dependent malic enzyme [Atribacteraceae bacterium]
MIKKDDRALNKPLREAMQLHPLYRGKVEVTLKCPVRNYDDFAIWYTPGVAEVCRVIFQSPDRSYELTGRGNTVAVVSDGSRVLGLGKIGPEAALPVMEGKALLFRYLGGVDAWPLCLRVSDPLELIDLVKAMEPSFGGINLEDIAQPACFTVLETLQKELSIPVWHDDQQGTALVTVAGLLGALAVVGKNPDRIRVALIGAGASNICIARQLMLAGVKGENMVLCDSRGILNRSRTDLKDTHPWKWELCEKTNGENIHGEKAEAIEDRDVLIALSMPGPGVIAPEWIKRMRRDAIVFACANPTPEIWPWEAREAGARVVATGRSDFPNQVNNSLGFPGLFRGVLSVQASAISDSMCLAAARALYDYAGKKGLREDYIIPSMEEWEVYVDVAVAVAEQARREGLSRRSLGADEVRAEAVALISRSQGMVKRMMEEGFIRIPEEERP